MNVKVMPLSLRIHSLPLFYTDPVANLQRLALQTLVQRHQIFNIHIVVLRNRPARIPLLDILVFPTQWIKLRGLASIEEPKQEQQDKANEKEERAK